MEGPAGRPATPHTGACHLGPASPGACHSCCHSLAVLKKTLSVCSSVSPLCWAAGKLSAEAVVGKPEIIPFHLHFPFSFSCSLDSYSYSFPSLSPTCSAPQQAGDGALPDMLNLKASPSCPAVTQGGRQYLSPLHWPLPDTLAIKMSKQVSLWKSNSPADLPLPAAAPVGHLFTFNLTHALKMLVLSTSLGD